MNAEVANLPKRRAEHHSWGAAVSVPADQTNNGCEQTERTCKNEGCGIVKITVHPPQGFPWREWRRGDSTTQFPGEHTPPCQGGR